MRALLIATLLCAACGDDGSEPLFPEDYATIFTEVRDCRPSSDHDLNNIRVLANAAAAGPYVDRDAPIPEGALLLKEEFDFGDIDCTGEIKQWTVMQRRAPGSSSNTLDWGWQRVDWNRNVVTEDEPRCIGCHQGCVAPSGYEFTCTVP
ncbi:MAG TPA: cytochrome P460 family protein [Kofleriaceae bacterium]|nr:cytochrome P460 family protein [Kofleriaceae bacterium]